MILLTLDQYWMGHDGRFGALLTPELRSNAERTVELVNRLIMSAWENDGIIVETSPRTGVVLTSGWRPPAVNEATPNAAPHSKHLTCQAADIYDPAGYMDDWLTGRGQRVLVDLGLWMEHPAATKGWCHVQTVAPHSGNRVFYP